MYQGKSRVKAVHFKLPPKQGTCSELEQMLNDPKTNVLAVQYAHNGECSEKWVLVIYEE
ncbi:MAG TPA: hypothetical protein VGN26_18970 [Armatimonadota bacterium]|jgi:hypothetical protein